MSNSPIPTAGPSGVYPCRGAAVKWSAGRRERGEAHARSRRRWAPAGRAGWAALVAALGGCAAAPSQTAPVARFAPYGAWYSVETAEAEGPRAALLDQDFACLAKMDLNAVFVRHCAVEDWPAVFAAARKHDLAVVLSDPIAQRHVRAGTGVGFADAAALPAGTVLLARFIGDVVDDVTYARAAALARAAGGADPPIATCAARRGDVDFQNETPFDYVLCADQGGPGGAAPPPQGAVQTIVCRQHRRDEEATVRQWLASFHEGLLRGCTGGIVFDAYRALPGNWQGLVQAERTPSPERIAMVRRIVARARQWAPLLAGLSVQPVEAREQLPAEMRAGCYSGGGRRFLLLVNPSPTQFLRTNVTFAASFDGAPIERAVTVPTAEDTLIGPVYPAHHDELAIPLDLPPGEARLFELF